MYCAASPQQYIEGAMSLDVEPTDGVYDQAVYTDFGRALTPAGVVGKIVTRTVKLRELKSPLTYFDSKMVGQTPTVAVTPTVTFTSFQDKAPVNVNMGYYDRTEIDQINIAGYLSLASMNGKGSCLDYEHGLQGQRLWFSLFA